VLLKRATHVELDWDLRQKSRFEASDTAGRQLGIFCHVAPCCVAAMCWSLKTAR
jgi:urease accessory protein UreE